MINTGVSYPQKLLYEIVKDLFDGMVVRCNDRTAIRPKEIDVYLPDLKIGFEYDGAHFHQDNAFSKEKDKLCADANIQLYRILELDKRNPLTTIKHQLENFGFNLSNINFEKIQRKCAVSVISVEEAKEIIGKYSSYEKLLHENKKLISQLRKLGLLEELTRDLTFKRKSLSYEEILNFLSKCKVKGDLVANPRFYQAFYRQRHPDLIKIYDALPAKNQAAKRPCHPPSETSKSGSSSFTNSDL